LFKAAAKALVRNEGEPKPEPRRRRGKTGKGIVATWRKALHRSAVKTAAAARGRYAALRPAKAAPATVAPAAAHAGAGMSLADTLEWLQLWQANSMDFGAALDDNFDTQQDRHLPQP
jgi:hypothetical protein